MGFVINETSTTILYPQTVNPWIPVKQNHTQLYKACLIESVENNNLKW